MSYAVDPTQPLPKRWSDDLGPIRVMTPNPVEGYVMIRRPGAMPSVISVSDLLGGRYEPILPKPKTNVRERIAALKAEQEAAIRKLAHGEGE